VREANDKKEWTTGELSEASGLTDARIRQLLIEDKDLHGHKLGRDWRVKDLEARRWLGTLEEA
jgi:hypothetical protein